jgi:hypothetical protein
MVPLIQFLLAVCALAIALTAGLGRRALAPLWVAVLLLAIAQLLPFAVSMAIR